MIKIRNFKHNEEFQNITFTVLKDGNVYEATVGMASRGTFFSCEPSIDSDWSKRDQDRLLDFAKGCSSILYDYKESVWEH